MDSWSYQDEEFEIQSIGDDSYYRYIVFKLMQSFFVANALIMRSSRY